MTEALAIVRCPECAAIVRPGQDWCTLCHADLRPAPEPEPEPAPQVQALPDVDPLTAPLAQVEPATAAVAAVAGTTGKHARRSAPATGEPETTAVPEPPEVIEAATGGSLEGVDVDAMLAELARQSGDPLLGGVSKQLSSRSAKAGLAIGLCLALTLVLLVGSVILVTVFG